MFSIVDISIIQSNNNLSMVNILVRFEAGRVFEHYLVVLKGLHVELEWNTTQLVSHCVYIHAVFSSTRLFLGSRVVFTVLAILSSASVNTGVQTFF